MALVLVTGASAGLGLATAQTLASQGHDVVVHARNKARLGDQPLTHICDVVCGNLADFDETLRVAEAANNVGHFDAVIHNAGTTDAVHALRVNVVAPYILTAIMRPPHRSIFLSSSMHTAGSADLDARVFGRGREQRSSYEDSKLYVTAFALGVAAWRPDAMSHAVDPGWVPTRMGGPSATDDFDEGHRTQEWLATAPETAFAPRTGGYWYHQVAREPRAAAKDPGFQGRLVRLLEELTGIPFAS